MKKIILIIVFLLQTAAVWAQNDADENASQLTLKEAYERVEKTWPATGKAGIQIQITELNRRIARSGFFPELQVNASMSYQSDVTEVPFAAPGSEPIEFSKDHYNLSLNITQPLFDGGRTRAQLQSEEHAGNAEMAKIRSEMLDVRKRLEQVWFGILMMQKQEENLELLRDDLREQLNMVQAQVENGALLPGNEWTLEAERIKTEQNLTQLRGDIRAGYKVLGEILDMKITPDTGLEIPEKSGWNGLSGEVVNRPEYNLFEANELRLDTQKRLAGADKLPTLSLFATSAYGRPGLNMFDDDLQFYWMAGVRARWSFKHTRNATLKTQVIDLQRRNLAADRDTFTRQLSAALREAEEEIEAIRRQIEQDEEVLILRGKVVEEKRNLLEQGAITSTEYLTELNAESRAKLDLEIRKIRLSRTIVEYETERGINVDIIGEEN